MINKIKNKYSVSCEQTFEDCSMQVEYKGTEDNIEEAKKTMKKFVKK